MVCYLSCSCEVGGEHHLCPLSPMTRLSTEERKGAPRVHSEQGGHGDRGRKSTRQGWPGHLLSFMQPVKPWARPFLSVGFCFPLVQCGDCTFNPVVGIRFISSNDISPQDYAVNVIKAELLWLHFCPPSPLPWPVGPPTSLLARTISQTPPMPLPKPQPFGSHVQNCFSSTHDILCTAWVTREPQSRAPHFTGHAADSAVRPWTSHLTSLGLSFSICKIGKG